MKGNRKREGKRTERTHRVTDRYVTNTAVSTRSTLHTVGFPWSSQQLQQQRTAAALWSVVCGLQSAVRPGNVGDVDVSRLDEPLIYLVLQKGSQIRVRKLEKG